MDSILTLNLTLTGLLVIPCFPGKGRHEGERTGLDRVFGGRKFGGEGLAIPPHRTSTPPPPGGLGLGVGLILRSPPQTTKPFGPNETIGVGRAPTL